MSYISVPAARTSFVSFLFAGQTKIDEHDPCLGAHPIVNPTNEFPVSESHNVPLKSQPPLLLKLCKYAGVSDCSLGFYNIQGWSWRN
jgi:hypothetical protein